MLEKTNFILETAHGYFEDWQALPDSIKGDALQISTSWQKKSRKNADLFFWIGLALTGLAKYLDFIDQELYLIMFFLIFLYYNMQTEVWIPRRVNIINDLAEKIFRCEKEFRFLIKPKNPFKIYLEIFNGLYDRDLQFCLKCEILEKVESRARAASSVFWL